MLVAAFGARIWMFNSLRQNFLACSARDIHHIEITAYIFSGLLFAEVKPTECDDTTKIFHKK
jgi:hypothetical protein